MGCAHGPACMGGSWPCVPRSHPSAQSPMQAGSRTGDPIALARDLRAQLSILQVRAASWQGAGPSAACTHTHSACMHSLTCALTPAPRLRYAAHEWRAGERVAHAHDSGKQQQEGRLEEVRLLASFSLPGTGTALANGRKAGTTRAAESAVYLCMRASVTCAFHVQKSGAGDRGGLCVDDLIRQVREPVRGLGAHVGDASEIVDCVCTSGGGCM